MMKLTETQIRKYKDTFAECLEREIRFIDAVAIARAGIDCRVPVPHLGIDEGFLYEWITSREQLDVLRSALSNGMSANKAYQKQHSWQYVTYNAKTLLEFAISNLCGESVDLLISAGADVLVDPYDRKLRLCKLACDQVLYVKANNGYQEVQGSMDSCVRILRALLKAGASPQWSPGIYESLPELAFRQRNEAALDLFLDHGAQLTTRYDGESGTGVYPLLFVAARDDFRFYHSSLNDTFWLITKGADVYDPGVCLHGLDDMKTSSLKRMYLDVVKAQFAEVAIGLKGLDLPVMCVLEIQNWVRELHPDTEFTMKKQWSLAKTVKELGANRKD